LQAFSLFVKAKEVPAAYPSGGAAVWWRCCRQTFRERRGIHRHVGTQHGGDVEQQATGLEPAGRVVSAERAGGQSCGELCEALPDTSGLRSEELTR